MSMSWGGEGGKLLSLPRGGGGGGGTEVSMPWGRLLSLSRGGGGGGGGQRACPGGGGIIELVPGEGMELLNKHVMGGRGGGGGHRVK